MNPAGPTAPTPKKSAGRASILLFGLKFGLLMAAYYALVLVPFFDRMLYGYLEANARISGAVLGLLGQANTVSEVTIRSAGFAVAVRRGCDAVEPAWFFCSAVLAFPAPLRRKLAGMLAGSAAILALNLVRIVSLFLLGLDAPRFFPAAHLEIWPAAFILAAVLLWAGWIRWARRASPAKPHAAA